MNAETSYPQFYRLAGHCLKRESDTTATEIRIPDPEKMLPLVHQPTTYPTKARLDEEVSRMEQVDQDVYEDYLGTFFAQARENSSVLNNIRQRRYEAGVLKLCMTGLYLSRQLFGL
ncbi:MAG TPA: hypothetical protein VK589_24285 [Chryseolinea sp.]|nr:hypothetical protein [Chryseolinea sp.]